MITGGNATIGTDKVWGKCLYKASSTLLPYTFALARSVAVAFDARYVSIQASSRYGQEHALLQLAEIDPLHERYRDDINRALKRLPRDRDAIREILGLPVTLVTYHIFNDVAGFHDKDKPWKIYNRELQTGFEQALRRIR